MVKLTVQNMEQICSLANVQVKPCKKNVNFYGDRIEITGYEVRHDGTMVATYCTIDGVLRVIYPRGSEASHTSCYGQALTRDYVLRRATNIALGEFEDAIRRAD